jgi:hypothetical protein
LHGRVALVVCGGEGPGRATALALAARGVHVLVTGRDERALGETVGEIVYGGGRARHLAGDPGDASQLRAAAARAHEVFGGLDIAVVNAWPDVPSSVVAVAFDAALAFMKGPGRLVVVARAPDEGDMLGLVRSLAEACAARAITVRAVAAGLLDDVVADDRCDELARQVVTCCADAPEESRAGSPRLLA